MIHNLTQWRQRGEACADTVLRADPSAAGQLVTLDESDGVLDHLGLWGDDQCDAELRAAGLDATEEHRDAVRAAAREGYVETMERRA